MLDAGAARSTPVEADDMDTLLDNIRDSDTLLVASLSSWDTVPGTSNILYPLF